MTPVNWVGVIGVLASAVILATGDLTVGLTGLIACLLIASNRSDR